MPLQNSTLLRMASAVDLHHTASIRRISAYRGEPFPGHQGNGEASLIGFTPVLGRAPTLASKAARLATPPRRANPGSTQGRRNGDGRPHPSEYLGANRFDCPERDPRATDGIAERGDADLRLRYAEPKL